MTTRAFTCTLAAVLVLGGTACGFGATPASACDTVSGGTDEKPSVTVPDDEPPEEFVSQDITEGQGTEAPAGGTVTVHYIGIAWSSGEQFDASWDGGQPVTFSLAQVVPGWQEGIPGMKVGGRRCLVLPPELGYGQQPPPGSGIEPGDTLVFVVDMLGVEGAEEPTTEEPTTEEPTTEEPTTEEPAAPPATDEPGASPPAEQPTIATPAP